MNREVQLNRKTRIFITPNLRWITVFSSQNWGLAKRNWPMNRVRIMRLWTPIWLGGGKIKYASRKFDVHCEVCHLWDLIGKFLSMFLSCVICKKWRHIKIPCIPFSILVPQLHAKKSLAWGFVPANWWMIYTLDSIRHFFWKSHFHLSLTLSTTLTCPFLQAYINIQHNFFKLKSFRILILFLFPVQRRMEDHLIPIPNNVAVRLKAEVEFIIDWWMQPVDLVKILSAASLRLWPKILFGHKLILIPTWNWSTGKVI